jgi:hypothetical protein
MKETTAFEVPDSDRSVSRARDGDGSTSENLDGSDSRGISLEDVKALVKEHKRDIGSQVSKRRARFLKERMKEKSLELTQSRDPKPERLNRILH